MIDQARCGLESLITERVSYSGLLPIWCPKQAYGALVEPDTAGDLWWS
jgi:hypothetical protein